MINKKEIMSNEKKCQATYGYVFRNFGICEIFFYNIFLNHKLLLSVTRHFFQLPWSLKINLYKIYIYVNTVFYCRTTLGRHF